jgi:hypothetical protein
MRIYGKFIGLLTACFIVFLLVGFPARAALLILAPAGAEAFGVTGTLWNGKARIINVAGQQLRNVEWDVDLPLLLTAQLGGDVKTRWNGGFLEGTGSLSLGGTITLENIVAGFDLAALRAMLQTPEIGGQASVRISRMQVQDNWPVELIGTGEIRDLSSPMLGRGDAARIGSVAIEFDTTTATDPNNLIGRLQDIGGFLELKGALTLTKPADYLLDVRIKARPAAPQSLQRNLEFLGEQQEDGSRIFNLAGSI